MKKSLCLLFLFFTFSALWAQNSGKKVTVAGLVGEMASYGAPGYGENPEEDDIEKFFVLIPDWGEKCDGKVVEWCGEEAEEVVLNSAMQLILMNRDISLKTGVRYRVTGTIMQAQTGHHHTDFLLCVESLKILRTKSVVRKLY